MSPKVALTIVSIVLKTISLISKKKDVKTDISQLKAKLGDIKFAIEMLSKEIEEINIKLDEVYSSVTSVPIIFKLRELVVQADVITRKADANLGKVEDGDAKGIKVDLFKQDVADARNIAFRFSSELRNMSLSDRNSLLATQLAFLVLSKINQFVPALYAVEDAILSSQPDIILKNDGAYSDICEQASLSISESILSLIENQKSRNSIGEREVRQELQKFPYSQWLDFLYKIVQIFPNEDLISANKTVYFNSVRAYGSCVPGTDFDDIDMIPNWMGMGRNTWAVYPLTIACKVILVAVYRDGLFSGFVDLSFELEDLRPQHRLGVFQIEQREDMRRKMESFERRGMVLPVKTPKFTCADGTLLSDGPYHLNEGVLLEASRDLMIRIPQFERNCIALTGYQWALVGLEEMSIGIADISAEISGTVLALLRR